MTDTRWLFLGGMAVLIALVGYGSARSALVLKRWLPPFNLLLSVPDNLFRLALIGVCIVLGAGWGPGPVALGWGTTHLGRDLSIGALAGLLLAGVLIVVGQLAVHRWGPEIYSPTFMQQILPINRREWAGVLLVLGPAALLEELLFRSLPLGGLGWLMAPTDLLWPLAVGFGLLHYSQGHWGMIGTMFAGIALSWLFLLTGSVWAVWLAHYIVNVAQIVMAQRSGLRPVRGTG